MLRPGLERALERMAKLCAEGKMDPVKAVVFLQRAVKFRDEVWPTLAQEQREGILAELRRMRDGQG